MLRKLLIVAALALLSIRVLAIDKTPSKSPEQRIVKESVRTRAKKSNQSDSNESTASQSLPLVAKQPTATAADPDKEQRNEDIAIQRKIANLTFWLVVVGFLQASVLAGTLVLIWRQASLMQEHATELKRLASTGEQNTRAMRRQAAIMRLQLWQMKGQAEATNKSADAALAQFKAMKSRERARVWITIDGDLNLGMGPFAVSVPYAVTQTGPTDGFLDASLAKVVISDIEPGIPKESGLHSIQVPNRLPPQFETNIKSPFFISFYSRGDKQNRSQNR